MMFLLPIVYAALAGIGLCLGADAMKNVKVTPGNWNKEMREYACRSERRAPHIGAGDGCIITEVANIAEKK